MRPLVVVGAGGHAKVVIATARAAGFTVTTLVDDDPALWGTHLLGVEISGPTGPALEDVNATCVLAIGRNATRRKLGAGARCELATLAHPSAVIDASVRLGPGAVVFAGAVIQPDTTLGSLAIINTGASVDHDGVLGEAVHVAPGARLAGNVSLGDEVFVGIGAVIVPGIRVGARATIGAGAVVVHELAPDVVAIGVPARPRGG